MSDQVIRAMTNDGAFRVIAAVSTATAAAAAKTQSVTGDLASRLAETMTGAILLRETTQPSRRLQISLRNGVGGSFVADSLPDGTTRGLVSPGEANPSSVGGDSLLQVTYTLLKGGLHQGVVAVPALSTISTALMTYMQESEQIVSTLVIGSAATEAGVELAGGYIVQLLPEADRDALEAMTERLAEQPDLVESMREHNTTAFGMIDLILRDVEHTIVAESELRFGCNCSRERVVASMVHLEGDVIEDILAKNEPLEVRCDSCGKNYRIEAVELAALQSES